MAGGSGVGESQCLVRVRQHWIEESKCRSHWEHDLGQKEPQGEPVPRPPWHSQTP